MLKNSDNFAKAIADGTKLDVHHIVPLEWAHVMGEGFDPNALDNLAGVDSSIHKEINRLWNEFRNTWKGNTPTADTVKKFAEDVGKKYGQNFVQ